MEQDWRSGALKTFVMVVLCQQVEYRAFRNTWEVDITIERRQVRFASKLLSISCDNHC